MFARFGRATLASSIHQYSYIKKCKRTSEKSRWNVLKKIENFQWLLLLDIKRVLGHMVLAAKLPYLKDPVALL